MQVLDFANRHRNEYVGSELERREFDKWTGENVAKHAVDKELTQQCQDESSKSVSKTIWFIDVSYSIGHGHCSITCVFLTCKSATLHTNYTRNTRAKHACKRYTKKYARKYTQIFGN